MATDSKGQRIKFFIDTEFIEAGPHLPITLLSIGIVCEDGRELYLEVDADISHASEWVRVNVFPHLVGPKLKLDAIAARIRSFVGLRTDIEFWGYYADYDWVVFAQIFGSMMDLPNGWPMFCHDIKQLCVEKGDPKLPQQDSTEHNALHDARWNKTAYEFLEAYSQSVAGPETCNQRFTCVATGAKVYNCALPRGHEGDCDDHPTRGLLSVAVSPEETKPSGPAMLESYGHPRIGFTKLRGAATTSNSAEPTHLKPTAQEELDLMAFQKKCGKPQIGHEEVCTKCGLPSRFGVHSDTANPNFHVYRWPLAQPAPLDTDGDALAESEDPTCQKCSRPESQHEIADHEFKERK